MRTKKIIARIILGLIMVGALGVIICDDPFNFFVLLGFFAIGGVLIWALMNA